MATASVAVRLNAITGEFETAFSKATRTVAGFEKTFGSAASSLVGHQQKINAAYASFSGDKIIAEANQLAAAVAKVGGASKLTEAEQRRVNAAVTEAIAKYQALGQQAPQSLTALANATKQVAAVTQPATLASKAMGVLSSTFGQFTAANLAATAINNVVGRLGEFVAQGSKLPGLEQSFSKLAKTVKQDSQEMLSAMQAGTRGLVSNIDLMQSANKAILLGLPVTSKEMGELAKTATVLGKAMGQDATSSLNDLITALGRSSPLILDNLGLTVKVGEANEAYAKSIGKTASQLTDAESKMAFYVAAMEAARKKTAEIGEQTLTLGDIAEKAWIKIGNAVTRQAAEINVGIGRILSSKRELANFLSDLATMGVGQAVTGANIRGGLEAAGRTGRRDINLPAPTVAPTKALDDHSKALNRVTTSTDQYAASVKALARELSGAKLEGDVKQLNDAWMSLSATQRQQPEILARVGKAAETLRLQGANLTAELFLATVRSGEFAKSAYKVTEGLSTIPGVMVDVKKHFQDFNAMLPPIGVSMEKLVGPQGIGQFIDVAKLGLPEVADELLPIGANLDDIARLSDRVGGTFGGVTQTILGNAASIVQGIGDIRNATDAWARSMAQANLALTALTLAYDFLSRPDRAASIRDDFLNTFADANTVLYENGRRMRTAAEGAVYLRERLAELGEEGQRLYQRLQNADSPGAALAAIQAIQDALANTPVGLAEAAGFQTISQLQEIADKAKRVYEYMRDSGEYTAEAVAEAFKRSRDAQIAALDDTARAALATNQKVVDGLKKQIDDLTREYDSIYASWAAEDAAPEFDEAGNRIYGVIEAQQRGRLDQIEAERKKAEEALIEANARIDESFAGLGPAAQTAAIEIVDAFAGVDIHIPVHFDVDSFNPERRLRGLDTSPTLALGGESSPEAIIPISGISSESGGGTAIFQLDGETLAEGVVPFIPGVVKRYGLV